MMKVLCLTILLLASCSSDSLEPRVSKLQYTSYPSGVRISSEVLVTDAKVMQIENGIRATGVRAICQGYHRELEISNYKVAIVQPTGTISGVNVIEYGKNKVAGVYSPTLDTIILVDQPDLTEIASYEAEHRVLLVNDKERYNATKYHTTDAGHPMFGECK